MDLYDRMVVSVFLLDVCIANRLVGLLRVCSTLLIRYNQGKGEDDEDDDRAGYVYSVAFIPASYVVHCPPKFGRYVLTSI